MERISTLAAVLRDMDGTLVDTEPLWEAGVVEVVTDRKEYGMCDAVEGSGASVS